MDGQFNNETNNKGITENDIMPNIDQFIIEDKLGEGIFGTVKLATHKLTNEKVAIKILNKNKISKAQKTLLSRELLFLQKMNHFNVIKLYSIIETEEIIYLIQEYSSGKELSNYIQNHSKVDEKEICQLFQQIISGIEYIHKMGISHRDLKPENILLTSANDIKIIDFGLSNIYEEGQLLKTSCGSPYYAPPEMLQGKPYNGLYSDIYSCGIILYYMLTKKLPFNENNDADLYKKK
jgi:5'-AMP-activated protein kinase catalytic alpha subunit